MEKTKEYIKGKKQLLFQKIVVVKIVYNLKHVLQKFFIFVTNLSVLIFYNVL